MNLPSLRKIAAREGIPLGIVEKDYVLSTVLSRLSENPLMDSLVFKGGTAIKKIYFPEARFSEDLDFNFLDVTSKKIENRINHLLIGRKIGDVEFLEMKNINHTDISFTCDISFTGQLQLRNKIKLDFSGREKPILGLTKQATTDIYGIRIRIPTLNIIEILAEKIRALAIRGKPRDLYDIWFLLNKNVTVDLD
ncbi:MAG: nucleotidyl transferase AbiEii/AbiGii toxin family protein, partial [Candidatus Altiarchaeales archaeon]|nr:nucleotidyl transferase AbiEii/AbiGii toxin family protein [Candidatus Altiarchaeales archaeon]